MAIAIHPPINKDLSIGLVPKQELAPNENAILLPEMDLEAVPCYLLRFVDVLGAV